MNPFRRALNALTRRYRDAGARENACGGLGVTRAIGRQGIRLNQESVCQQIIFGFVRERQCHARLRVRPKRFTSAINASSTTDVRPASALSRPMSIRALNS
jgi:hypothetical protein